MHPTGDHEYYTDRRVLFSVRETISWYDLDINEQLLVTNDTAC